jgi:hypothetical protein
MTMIENEIEVCIYVGKVRVTSRGIGTMLMVELILIRDAVESDLVSPETHLPNSSSTFSSNRLYDIRGDRILAIRLHTTGIS